MKNKIRQSAHDLIQNFLLVLWLILLIPALPCLAMLFFSISGSSDWPCDDL